MKVKLDEQTLKAYINEAIEQELNENMDEWLGLSRSERNAKWGYEWDPNLSAKQNRRNRSVNKALIKQKGYRNHDEYMAGEGHAFGDEPQQEQPQEMPFQTGEPAPFSGDKQKVGQFQTWFNHNFGGKLVVDGIWGKYTQRAWDQWVSQQGQVNENKESRKTLSESQFKTLVKDTITELLNN